MAKGISLKDGARVAVIGGGPGGSLFAHFILKLAQKKGMYLKVVIFDGKDFLQPGPSGCNLCAGVIAESLHKKLNEEGLIIPEKRIISRVEGYFLHVENHELFLPYIENAKDKIATVFRGNGPRYSTFPGIISFDDFLLSWAQDRSAEVIAHPVWKLDLPLDKNKPVTLFYGKRENPKKFEADLVVGAFGVNASIMKKMQELGFGYKPPSTLVTYQAEVKLGAEKIFERFGNAIHIYMSKLKTIRFATIIPKGDYITLTLIGKKNLRRDILQEFLSLKGFMEKIPLTGLHCFCSPRIAVSPARRPFTDRLVIIGDASFCRHYKNGIESAFITAKLAAETAIKHGIDRRSFAKHFYRLARKQIIRDNRYGRLLFFLNDCISNLSLLSQSHLDLARKPSPRGSPKKLRTILWNMSTGNIPYRDIFILSLDLKLQLPLFWNTIKVLMERLKKYLAKYDK